MAGKYSADSVKQISGKRTAKVKQIIRQCGGTIVGVYALLGEADILVIAEFPSIDKAMKASVGLNKALGISFATIPALRVEDFDKLVAGKP